MKSAKTLTTAQVAKRLAVTAYVVRVLLQKGRIPGVKLNSGDKSRWRIDADDLEAWIADQKKKNSRGRVRK